MASSAGTRIVYSRGADLRFPWCAAPRARINEHVDGIALAEGAAGQSAGEWSKAPRQRDDGAERLTRGLTSTLPVSPAGFGELWITGIAPVLVAAPCPSAAGNALPAALMMAAAAFTQAQGSLRWFVDNFSSIADWRATLLRVANFRQALVATGRRSATSKAASPTKKARRAR